MTASVSTNININDTATTQPSTNGQAGHTNESIKPLQPVLLQSAAEKTVPSPPGVNKASGTLWVIVISLCIVMCALMA